MQSMTGRAEELAVPRQEAGTCSGERQPRHVEILQAHKRVRSAVERMEELRYRVTGEVAPTAPGQQRPAEVPAEVPALAEVLRELPDQLQVTAEMIHREVGELEALLF